MSRGVGVDCAEYSKSQAQIPGEQSAFASISDKLHSIDDQASEDKQGQNNMRHETSSEESGCSKGGFESETAVEGVVHIRDYETGEVRSRLKVRDHTGRLREVPISRNDLRSPRKIRELLDSAGCNGRQLSPEEANRLAEISRDNERVEVSSPRWCGKRYLFPKRRIKKRDGRTIYFAPSQAAPPSLLPYYRISGDSEGWSRVCEEVLKVSDFVLFSCGVVLAGPLVSPTGLSEGAIFHLVGDSGSGKTTALVLAKSLAGSVTMEELTSWDSTVAGLEQLFEAGGQSTLVIDDESRSRESNSSRGAMVSQVGHLAAGGGRRTRARAYEAERGASKIRPMTFALSSGEEAHERLLAKAGERLMGGAAVRFIEIPVPSPAKGGILNRHQGTVGEAKGILRRAMQGVRKQHGRVFRDYVRALEHMGSEREKRIAKLMKAFTAAHQSDLPDGVSVQRVTSKFALVYAALVLAVDAGLIPADLADVDRAVGVCLRAAVRKVGVEEDRLSNARACLVKLLAGRRCPKLAVEECEGKTLFKRSTGGKLVAYATSKVLQKRLNLAERELSSLIESLAREKLLVVGSGARTLQVRRGSEPRIRMYGFPKRLWASGKPASAKKTER